MIMKVKRGDDNDVGYESDYDWNGTEDNDNDVSIAVKNMLIAIHFR